MAERGVRKKMSGVVVSDKMDKTVVVQVERQKRHQEGLKARLLLLFGAHRDVIGNAELFGREPDVKWRGERCKCRENRKTEKRRVPHSRSTR